ncbi:MAG: helix-turn-helix domain-containing protein [Candidatus Eisenbacteria bacterium]|uniref:Helix-turn-helix domain-containing protein n=1 Tax=Eiseniibacteriota bacterium TaxID=2212470 RepID=A0A956M1D6_UNCEI|nr:helix-turn-helix domain-containing protein [Candidatus Eisenbacteria bacterium]
MRIRHVRQQQHKTLRDVESASGFSSTHISEIERGRTSPTIGALIQIAHALEKDPSYFIEERELDEVRVTTMSQRPAVDPAVFDVAGTGIQVDGLTTGILGGRLYGVEISLDPGANGRVSRMPEPVDVACICAQGAVELGIGDAVYRLDLEDSLHAVMDEHFSLRNAGTEPARLILFLDPGLSQA